MPDNSETPEAPKQEAIPETTDAQASTQPEEVAATPEAAATPEVTAAAETTPAEAPKNDLAAHSEPGNFDDYEKWRKGEQSDASEAKTEQKPPESTPAPAEKAVADGEADNAKENKSSDDPEEGENADASTTDSAKKESQPTGGNPRWLNRRISKAVKNATQPLAAQIEALKTQNEALLEGSPANKPDPKQPAAEIGEEPDPGDYTDWQEFKAAHTAWGEASKAASKAAPQESPEGDSDNAPQQEEHTAEERRIALEQTVADIDETLDDHDPQLREDFWKALESNKVAWPAAFTGYMDELVDSSKVVNIAQHFLADPQKSRRIARMMYTNVEQQREAFADLAETPFVAAPAKATESKASAKPTRKAPDINPVNSDHAKPDWKTTDADIPFAEYEKLRAQENKAAGLSGY